MKHLGGKLAAKKVALTIHEPLKFEHDLLGEISNAVDYGYRITLAMEGPEAEIPAHVYHDKQIEKAKFFVYLMNYWMKMRVTVEGHNRNENKEELGHILGSVNDQIEAH